LLRWADGEGRGGRAITSIPSLRIPLRYTSVFDPVYGVYD